MKEVLAPPFSLATTQGMTFRSLFLGLLRCFSSPGSLRATYVFSYGYTGMTLCGFPHSDIAGSKLACQLPNAFRRLLRPSSVSLVKASVMCPSRSLDFWIHGGRNRARERFLVKSSPGDFTSVFFSDRSVVDSSTT
jgi:hypothetical protein